MWTHGRQIHDAPHMRVILHKRREAFFAEQLFRLLWPAPACTHAYTRKDKRDRMSERERERDRERERERGTHTVLSMHSVEHLR